MKLRAVAIGLFGCATMAHLQVAGQSPVTSSPASTQTTATALSPAPKPILPTAQLPEDPPRSTVPSITRYLNNPNLLIFCTSQVGEFNDRDADIIFIGDSITQGWLGKGKTVWDANFAPRSALDFGISGDQTQHVLWRMENYPIAHLHPRLAIILIGTNNQGNTPEEIAGGVKAIINKTQAMYPGIKIILNSIMPNRRANDLMMKANTVLRTFADGKSVNYLDLIPIMTPDGDNWKGLGPDHLHPDADGYQLWADALLPLVNRLLSAPASATPSASPH